MAIAAPTYKNGIQMGGRRAQEKATHADGLFYHYGNALFQNAESKLCQKLGMEVLRLDSNSPD